MGRHNRNERPYIKKVEFAFYNEHAIRDAVYEARLDSFTPEVRNGSGLPDPTATAAIKNLVPVAMVLVEGTPVTRPESWLTVVEKTYNWCKNQGQIYYDMAKHRYGGAHFVRICSDLDIVPERFFRMLEKIRNYACLQAAQLNLIYVE